MAKKVKVELREDVAIFTMADGSEIEITYSVNHFGLKGYGLMVLCSARSGLLVEPMASNHVTLTSEELLKRRREAVQRVVDNRNKAKI